MITYKQIHEIENESIPSYLKEFIAVKEFQRLKNVGMSCGLEYTSFPFFKDIFPYSRYDHSIGVALLLSRFTDDKKIIISGLYHDISTPCFAHVIDFLNGDREKQESTEEKTKAIIRSSIEIQNLLKKYNLLEDDINDYHLYPLADNDTPKLSCDRLEYHIGNSLQYKSLSLKEMKEIISDLVVLKNEIGEVEIGFSTLDLAKKFVKASLINSRTYISNEDRYSMEILARLLKDFLVKNIISQDDLYLEEPYIIEKINSNPYSKELFDKFKSLSEVDVKENERDGYINIRAKKRYINPLIKNKGRILDLDSELKENVDELLKIDFKEYLKGKQI